MPRAAGEGSLDKPVPYVLITTDGYRLDAMAPPERTGDTVKIRLAPHGQLTILSAGRVDWPATERFNAPRPEPVRKREPVSTAEGAHSLASSAGREPGEPIEMTIIGERSSVRAAPTPEAGGTAAEAPGVAPAVPADPAKVAAEMAGLRRQMAALKGDYEESVRTRTELETRQAELRQKVANEPPASGIQDYQSPSRKALAQVEARLTGLSERISTLERRMNDLRFRAVELGEVLD